MGTYIELLHGRKDPEEHMEDWGFNGPIIGPVSWVHMTYMSHLRFRFNSTKAARENGFNDPDDHDLNIVDDMIELDGNYYGDFSIYNATAEEVKKDREKNKRHPRKHKEVFEFNK